jgi:hypothetical protein
MCRPVDWVELLPSLKKLGERQCVTVFAACEVSGGSGLEKLQRRSRTERSQSATSGGFAAAHRPPRCKPRRTPREPERSE